MRAGFGKADITPRVGVELYGFGPFLNRKSIGIRDILEARSCVLECDGHIVVIISLDLCAIHHKKFIQKIRDLIMKRHPELQACDIMINTSHTHSGPAIHTRNTGWGVTDPPYVAILPGRIVASVEEAYRNLEEVKVSQAMVPCRHMGLNRVYDKDAPPLADVLHEEWEPAKPELTDTECRVIRFDSVDGRMIGFMANFGCHPVVCCAANRYIHGDWPGVAMHTLMREFPGSVGMFLQGAEGDVNSGCVHKGEQESLLALDVFAARFANAVRKGLEQAEEISIPFIRSISKEFFFQGKPVFSMEKLEELQREQESILLSETATDENGECRMAAVYLQGIEIVKGILERGEKGLCEELHIIRMGDLQFMGAPFEIMQAIKNDIVSASRAKYPIVMSLTNGSRGYAPDNESLQGVNKITGNGREGNYESIKVPLIAGQLPFADIHNELVHYMAELEEELDRE
ncbi:MAG: neutral/alkaline non-lysosomal ceramidase N-terminal domain-containing protein [Lentisphaeria bacterium]|nr:neutral/alkaline non-lysosomal ceramidase N-terminal domain-containing protein [Lentisphaeria bacterium]